MTSQLADIEIYLKRVALTDIINWLSKYFEVLDQESESASQKIQLRFNGEPLECTLLEGAASGGYTSLWFKDNHTPWPDDEACARDAFDHFKCEIRFANGSWDDTGDEGGWIRLAEDGESVVNWKT